MNNNYLNTERVDSLSIALISYAALGKRHDSSFNYRGLSSAN